MEKKYLISRRTALITGVSAIGALLLPGCKKPTLPTYGNLLRMGDLLTYSAQRALLPGQSLAKEYSSGDISSFPATGTVNPADETLRAFRTNTVRNSSYTKPYMHNGVFNTMDEVIDFYDTGGGSAHGFDVSNQTLESDSLHLTTEEKNALKIFLKTLDEHVVFEKAPSTLPASKLDKYKNRISGGNY